MMPAQELADLDRQVAEAMGLNVTLWFGDVRVKHSGDNYWSNFRPSTDWIEAGRIAAEREFEITFCDDSVIVKAWSEHDVDDCEERYADHPPGPDQRLRAACVAICRAVVAGNGS